MSEPEVGIKHDDGKPRFDLIPARPLVALADLYRIGAAKYDDRNWENGIAFSRLFAALQRHAWAWWGGEERDPVDGQHHMSSVAWCAFAIQELLETKPGFDDRPKTADAPSSPYSPGQRLRTTTANLPTWSRHQPGTVVYGECWPGGEIAIKLDNQRVVSLIPAELLEPDPR